MQINVAAIPKRLAITQTMMDDFMTDPVLAAYCILGWKFDAFQAVRLRFMWWVRELIDSSGYSSGKTRTDFAFTQLRCILIPEQDGAVFYPTFATGKNAFWKFYSTCNHPVFLAQLGRLDEKGDDDGASRQHGAAFYKAFYRSGGTFLMPAPSHLQKARTMASLRLNFALFEEWTHVDDMGESIDLQLIGRVTKPCWNQHHPIWGNHLIFTAPAKTQMHRAHNRVKKLEQRIRRGDLDVHHISFSFKDYSNLPAVDGKTFKELYRDEKNIASQKANLAAADYLGEVLGIWGKSGRGWFTEEAIANCIELGRQRNLLPVTSAAEGSVPRSSEGGEAVEV